MTSISTPGPHHVAPAIQQPTVDQLRHRAEVPMLVLGGSATAAGAASVIALTVFGETEVPDWALAGLFAFVAPVMLFFLIRWMFWNTVSNGVEITPRQLPEIHRIYEELCVQMAVPFQPRLYLINGNGTLNAFASKCQLRRSYVTLYSDIVDIAYELGDFSGVKFVIAHELGHIKCGHVNLWRSMTRPVLALARLDMSIDRAQEYTADRCASYYAPEGARQLIFLYAGKRVYQRIDIDAYMASVAQHKDGFWLMLANLFSSHAVGFRRMSALYQVKEKGWNIHGRML